MLKNSKSAARGVRPHGVSIAPSPLSLDLRGRADRLGRELGWPPRDIEALFSAFLSVAIPNYSLGVTLGFETGRILEA